MKSLHTLAAAVLSLWLGSGAQATVRVDIDQGGGAQFLSGTGSVTLAAPADASLGAGPVSASADEVRGTLQAAAASTVGSTFASAILRDEVNFTVAGSVPITAYLRAWFEGTTSADFGVAEGALELRGINRASNEYTYSNRYLFDGRDCPPELSCVEGSSIGEQVSLAFTLLPGEQTVFLQAELNALGYRDGRSDFGNSAYLWLDVPSGVSWTPTTEGFLSLAAPVPEPSSWVLLALGLAAVGTAARRPTVDRRGTMVSG